MVATASRASSAEHAVVRVVSASTWGLLGAPLAGHSLTVTRIAFSPDDAHVLTVSRDRGWRLFSRAAQGYEPCAEEPRAHARMVLDCAWLSAASFVTASRDKSAKIWVKNDTWAVAHTITLKEAVTSVAVAASEGLIALGTESGAVEIHAFADGKVTPLTSVPAAQRHAGAVTRLAWSGRMLASAGEDRAVRVFGVTA
jgi:WD40 repeat protein